VAPDAAPWQTYNGVNMDRKLLRKRSSDPKIRPVSRKTISDEIVEQIMALIERGDLKPGQRLPSERELCVRFGSGRSSLREALRCLSIVGVLHARVGEGTSVAVDSGKFLGKLLEWRLITEQQNIENLMEVRMALEGLTAANMAVNGTAEDLQKLDALLGKMDAARNDLKRFMALDLEFHIALAGASGNSLATDLIKMIRGQLARALSRVLMPPNARPLSLQEHIKIIDKVRAHDQEGARNAMYLHLQASLDRYRKSLIQDQRSQPEQPLVLKQSKPKAPRLDGHASGTRRKATRTKAAPH